MAKKDEEIFYALPGVIKIKPPRVKSVKVRPVGYRILGEILSTSPNSFLFEYYGHELWISKRLFVRIRETQEHAASLHAIEESKAYNEKINSKNKRGK